MAQIGIPWNFQHIPIVTRVYTAACLITTAAVEAGIISPFHLYFNPELIFKKLQIWRLLTNFLYFGDMGFSFGSANIFYKLKLSVDVAAHLILVASSRYRHCKMLEEASFRGRTADFVLMFLFGGSLITLFGLFSSLTFFSQAFTHMLVYIWCRRNPSIRLNILGIITLQAPLLPWVFLGISLLNGDSAFTDFLGIAAGHSYYFLEDVYPNQPGGRKLLVTPAILKQIFDEPLRDPNYDPLPEDIVNRPNHDQPPQDAHN